MARDYLPNGFQRVPRCGKKTDFRFSAGRSIVLYIAIGIVSVFYFMEKESVKLVIKS
jgi:hypothetical protein